MTEYGSLSGVQVLPEFRLANIECLHIESSQLLSLKYCQKCDVDHKEGSLTHGKCACESFLWNKFKNFLRRSQIGCKCLHLGKFMQEKVVFTFENVNNNRFQGSFDKHNAATRHRQNDASLAALQIEQNFLFEAYVRTPHVLYKGKSLAPNSSARL